MNVHIPVLLNEVIKFLNPKDGEIILDATLGGGGHSEALCSFIGQRGTIVGLDADSLAIERAEERLKRGQCQKYFIQENFRNLSKVLNNLKISKVDKILFDLGVSSNQLEFGEGFSFQRDDNLQMTFNPHPQKNTLTAEEIVNNWDEENLADIIFYYGDEGFAKRIAKGIVTHRKNNPLKTTFDLISVIKESVPMWYQKKRIHFATKTFQALRITTNDELKSLEEALENSFEKLSSGGRIAVISFHSLEDRIVKRFFKKKKEEKLAKILTKKPITASEEERSKNKRSRSAKLRVLEKN